MDLLAEDLPNLRSQKTLIDTSARQQERDSIESEVQTYLDSGHTIECIPFGVSQRHVHSITGLSRKQLAYQRRNQKS